MEGGQSVVTLSLLASLAIFGALFGPTKFGDGGEIVTTTVTGPVITEHKHVEKKPAVVKTTTQEFIKRELDWLAREKEQLSLLKSYLSGARIKRDEKVRRTRDISTDLLELEKRQMALLQSVMTTNKYLQYAVAFLSVVAVYVIIRNKGREQDEKIATPTDHVAPVEPEPKKVDVQEDVLLKRKTNVSATTDLDLDILQVSNQEPEEQEEVLNKKTAQQQSGQTLAIPSENEKNGEVFDDVIIRHVEEPVKEPESNNVTDNEPSKTESVPETTPVESQNKPLTPRRVVFGFASLRGVREENEDTHVAIPSLPTDPSSSYFAVFDGHGGKQASSYCSRKLHLNMLERKCYSTDKRKALIKGFLITDHDYLLKTPEDGCTALAALLTADNTLYVANAGDSRGVMCKGGEVIAMTEDHKPNNETEILRINAAGCEVTAEDVHMNNDTIVTIYRVNDMLAVSRAIGDSEFKDLTLEPEEQAVTAYPDVYEYQLDIGDFFVLACDGVWDVLTNEEVIELVKVQYSMYKNLNYVAKVVAQEAIEKGSTDNVTIVIVGLESV